MSAPLSSDLGRARPLLFASIAAALAIVAAVHFSAPSFGAASPGPLSRPHALAGIACASCHAGGVDPTTACARCHGSHASTRSAHRALFARGELSCTSCHAAHDGGQGVTFGRAGEAVRWGGGRFEATPTQASVAPGTTVTLAPLSACTRCHDPARAGDPIRACAVAAPREPAAPRAVTCFDEHRRGDARFVAWGAAREIARTTPWLAPRDERARPWGWVAAAFGIASLVLVAPLARRRSRSEAVAPAQPLARVRLPTINPSTCLGCNACVEACPFDVLAIERYVAVVARPTECCGVGTCADVCPNESLRLEDGAPRTGGARLDDALESPDVPGLFLAGDLTGLPLIKNAIAQGVKVADCIAERRARRGLPAALDVVIVGAGPAGLSAALRAKERGTTCVVLEQATLAASIRAFPRDKLVYDPPLDVPVAGALWLKESTKEELLAQWTRIVRVHGVDVRERHRAVRIERAPDGAFEIEADAGGAAVVFRAGHVVIATGRRGTPRALDCPIDPAAESRVSYALADAPAFAHKRVVVVGLGDAAMEAACAIARQPGAHVTVSYRGADFARGKGRNIAETRRLAEAGAIRIVFESTVTRVDASRVELSTAAGVEHVAFDAVLVLIGGVPSWDLVRSAGVVVASESWPSATPSLTNVGTGG